MSKKFTIGLGDVTNVSDGGQAQTVKVPLKGVLGAHSTAATLEPVVQIRDVQIDPSVVNESDGSQTVFHSTLFESFKFSAVSTYNFYTADETTAFTTNPSASLDELPRYVTLTWRPSPRRGNLQASSKGTKPDIVSIPPRPPIVSIDVINQSAANGYIAPGVLSAIISEPSPRVELTPLNEDAFLIDPTAAGQLAAEHIGDTGSKFVKKAVFSPELVRVNFVDPSIAGAMDVNRIDVAADEVHLMVAGSLSKVIGGLEVISEFNQDVPSRNPPPSFPASTEPAILEYIGYVIERHDVLPDGSMRLGRTIKIDNVETSSFIDKEVLYDRTYAYRIRSIVQWVHPTNVGFNGVSPVDRVASVDEVIGARVASYYFGDWSDWSKTTVADLLPPDPPDEIRVQSISNRSLIRVSWKMPYDPQDDIDGIHLLRARVTDGSIEEWTDLGAFIPGNGAYDDTDVLPYSRSRTEYVYALYSTSVHGNRSVLSEQIMTRLSDPGTLYEHPVKRVRPIGADPLVHPRINDPRESTEVIATRRVTVYCRGTESVHPLRDKDYLFDVRSLSTGERVSVDLNVDSTEIISRDA